ncbi:hypothetical protein AB0G42_21425 [Streptomyces yangpuensis]|uniref:hypothetical protein n=1 Tax=Streptomyces yangpuensis TaxID=1648182 RepID=UPI00341B9A4B
MARGVLSVKQANRDGMDMGTPTTGDVANGHVVANDGNTGLLVKNTGSTSARNVTFRLFKTVDGQAVTPRTESVPVGLTYLFGPFPTAEYGSQLEVDVSHAELTLQAVRV